MNRSLQFLFVLVLGVLPGCGGSGWHAYSAPDGKFTVQLPGTPDVKEVEDGWQDVSSEAPEERILFHVRYKDFPDAISPAEFRRMANFSRDGLVAREGNKLVSERPIKLNGYPGRETKVAVGAFDDVSLSRIYAVGNRYYDLTVIAPKKYAASATVRKFFDSFEVRKEAGP
jgi:hypothetical protein